MTSLISLNDAYYPSGKKIKEGEVFRMHINSESFGQAGHQGPCLLLDATVVERMGREALIRFEWCWDGEDGAVATEQVPVPLFGAVLDAGGTIPLPPYLKREADERDEVDYQTVYASGGSVGEKAPTLVDEAEDEATAEVDQYTGAGSVAAPTAGLHMSERVWSELSSRGVGVERVQLHVGAGTFLCS